jgi:mRNA interferase RelE/StbE
VPYLGFAFTDAALDFLGELPPKIRRQVIKKAKALHTTPYPPTSKKLHGIATSDGDPVYRERSGDYRILYVVRSKPYEVLILDIDHRKDVYRMPKTDPNPADELRMKESDFDSMMRGALGAPPPSNDEKEQATSKRLSAYPRKGKK